MQYGDNYGYLCGDSLVVIGPGKAPAVFRYTRMPRDQEDRFEPAAGDPALIEEALTFALWPSWAYLHERYKTPLQ